MFFFVMYKDLGVNRMTNPFQYLNAINDTKQDVMVDDIAEKAYNSFMVNRGLSYFKDTVIFANGRINIREKF